MNDAAKDVTYRTFRKHCAEVAEWAKKMKYDQRKSQGLTLKDDWHVGYYRSVFQGKACYFIRHSHIEYIWVKE